MAQADRTVRLAFGRAGLEIRIADDAEVIAAAPRTALPNPDDVIRQALRRPTHGSGTPLASLVPVGGNIAVSVCDVTRPFPTRTVLPVLVEELPGRRVQVLIATGSHRPCTTAELEGMFGSEVMNTVRIDQHVAEDREAHLALGVVPGSDVPARVDRRFLDADVRMTLGFVEPHFFAGFSGGPKMVAPGLAALETIQELHSAARIGDARAIWGVLDGNPVHDPIRAIASRAGVSFALDVVLDDEQRIAAVFSGDLEVEHRAACEHVRATAMVRVPRPFDVVVTTNSGYPLDQNLYQCVKGLRAAAGIVRDGGTIILAAECADGLPSHGRYADLLGMSAGPADFLDRLARGEIRERDQWQVQVQAEIQVRARVLAYTPGVSPGDLRRAWLEPVGDVEEALRDALAAAGPCARAAILPEGPQTIAYVA